MLSAFEHPIHSDQPHPHPSSGVPVTGTARVRLEANLSILDAAPFLTALPTPIASIISLLSAPYSRALFVWYCKHGFQFAVTDAPTAINSLIRSSSIIMYHLLSDPIDGFQSEKDTF